MFHEIQKMLLSSWIAVIFILVVLSFVLIPKVPKEEQKGKIWDPHKWEGI